MKRTARNTYADACRSLAKPMAPMPKKKGLRETKRSSSVVFVWFQWDAGWTSLVGHTYQYTIPKIYGGKGRFVAPPHRRPGAIDQRPGIQNQHPRCGWF